MEFVQNRTLITPAPILIKVQNPQLVVPIHIINKPPTVVVPVKQHIPVPKQLLNQGQKKKAPSQKTPQVLDKNLPIGKDYAFLENVTFWGFLNKICGMKILK